MTKSVTAALVGSAVEEGLVDSIHGPIEDYIPRPKQRMAPTAIGREAG